MSLFASGYETKPALSVPIHVVELTNVPQELRQQATVSNQQTNKNIPPPEKASTNWVRNDIFISEQNPLLDKNECKKRFMKECQLEMVDHLLLNAYIQTPNSVHSLVFKVTSQQDQ